MTTVFVDACFRGRSGHCPMLLTRDEVRRIATNIAKLPELLRGSLKPVSATKRAENGIGLRSIIRLGEQVMPLSTLVPFALVALIGIVVLYAAYRAGAWRSAPRGLAKREAGPPQCDEWAARVIRS